MAPPVALSTTHTEALPRPPASPMRNGRGGGNTPARGGFSGGRGGRRPANRGGAATLAPAFQDRERPPHTSTVPEPAAQVDGAAEKPSLLSRMAPRSGEVKIPATPNGRVVPALVLDPASPLSPKSAASEATTPKASHKSSLSIKGVSQASRPPNSRKASHAKKASSSSATNAPSLPLPPKPAASSSELQRAPSSVPSKTVKLPSEVGDRPASALAVSALKEASIRDASPTPRISWADETDDDELPDLDDWNIGGSKTDESRSEAAPELAEREAVEGVAEVEGPPTADVASAEKDGSDAPAEEADKEEEEPTSPDLAAEGQRPAAGDKPVFTGPPKERRKRGAGKQKKALKAAESAAQRTAGPKPAIAAAIPATTGQASGTAERLEPETPKGNGLYASMWASAPALPTTSATPKGTNRSPLPVPASAPPGPQSFNGVSPPKGPRATNSTYRPPSLRTQPPTAPSDQNLAPRPASAQHSRERATPSPIPSSAGLPPKPAPSPVPAQAPFAASRPHSANPSSASRPPRVDPPITLPKKHARPVITADAITRLTRGLMISPKNGAESKAKEAGEKES